MSLEANELLDDVQPLPAERRMVQFTDNGLIVAAFCNGPDGRDVYWLKLLSSDFRQNLASLNDLESAILAAVNAAAIRKGVPARALNGVIGAGGGIRGDNDVRELIND